MKALEYPQVREATFRAWEESFPGTNQAHEEGGFVLRLQDGSFGIERWPRGDQDEIVVPSHPHGRRGEGLILATFHTHPNTGVEYLQEPSVTDVRAVREDPDLAHPEYEGEYVVAKELTYLIRRNGQVETVGRTDDLLQRDQTS